MRKLRRLLKNERGQGFVEYVLLVAIVVGLLVVFKDRLKGMVDSVMGKAESQVKDF